MAKFTTDYVNLIANNLRDRYKTGFPVLKELVQNADDAGATSLTFGYHPGFADAVDHELLMGPALWVLNNGRFTAQDRQAIRSFGLNSKAAESGAIGKFGLGMKSVFHLCEAFFYVASDGSQSFHEILSPWFQDAGSHEMHQRWEDAISQRDLDALNAAARQHLPKQESKSWFMLWVPMRRKTHVPHSEGVLTAPIIDRFPGDEAGKDLDFFTEPDIERRIGRLIPLLRNLQRISFMGTDALPAFDLKVELHQGSQRLDHVSDALQARGSVADSGAKASRLHFVATQTVREGAAPFNRLQASDQWPKSNAIVADGRRAPVPDKARPEGAVVFSHADKRHGHLSLQWAVFLPTEEGRYRYEAHIPDSSREYNITLHGQFFVDAGRRGIDGMERLAAPIATESKLTTESSVHLAWNQALAQQLVLPGVLPGLASYVEAQALTDAQVSALTMALVQCTIAGETGAQARFFETYLHFICSKHAWVRTLRAMGPRWELIGAEAKLLPLPRPVSNDHARPWRALPGLRNLADFIFIDDQSPGIYRPQTFWNETRVEAALSDLPSETLIGEVELKYLVEFLNMHTDRALNTSQVQRQLVRQMRKVIRQVSLADLRRHRQLFQKLAGFLPATRRYGLGPGSADAKGTIPEPLYQHLLAIDTEALLLPSDLSPDDIGRPSRDDLSAWLVRLDQKVVLDQENDRVLEVAEELLKAIGDEKTQAELLRVHPKLRILRATDVRGKRDVATSLEDLSAKRARGLVFRSTNPKDPLGLTTQLVGAVPSLDVHVVRGYVGKLLPQSLPGEFSKIPSTEDSAAVFACIGEQPHPPDLGAISLREKFLERFDGTTLGSSAVKLGIRYLLHGNPERFKSEDTLWKDPSGQDSPWVRLWRMTTEDDWNVLPSELSGLIGDKHSSALGIRAVEQENVVRKLKLATNFERVDATKFSESELDQILGGIDDETTWRKLPLHRDQLGHFGAVVSRCFLGSKPELPEGIGKELRFIVPSREENHFRRQKQHISEWSPARAAEEVLRTDDAVLHWRYLMDILSELSPAPTTSKAWTESKWLPLSAGGSISPSSLIQLDGMDAEISDLSAQCDFAYAGLAELSDDLRKYPGFDRLRALAPSGAKALPVLAQLMANAGFSVGATIAKEPELLQQHQALLCDLSSLPCWKLIFKADAATSLDDVAAHLLRDVTTPLRTQQVEQVLQDLAKRSLSPGEQAIYLVYLREWANSAAADELSKRLPALTLRASDGTWKPAQVLVCGAPGIDAGHCLHPEFEKSLHGIVATNDGLPLDTDSGIATAESEELRTALERWCEPFEQSSVRPAIGAVIGLFGTGVQALAERWLDPITYETYVQKLAWKDPGYEDGPFRRKRWMGGHATHAQPFDLLQPALVEAQESSALVTSLTGESIEVPLASADAMDTLLAGPLNWLGGYGVQVCLRPLDCLHSFGLQRQKTVLQKTAEDLWRGFYNQVHANLTDLWSLFEEADQVELEIAQSLILEGLPQLIAQLSKRVQRQPSISQALSKVDDCRRQDANERLSKKGLQVAQDRFYVALDELADLVKTDGEAQAALLEGIREKMAKNQYEPSSIPFEILQNADDAVHEYQAMLRAEQRSLMPQGEIGRFVIADTDQGLMLMHWGRPINYTGKHQGYRAEFAKDLERMLMLGASAKESEDGVTGKFGLGFKSVLLVSDKPIVASGDLHFEIVAGCLPQRAELSPSAKNRAAFYKLPNLRPTVVELPLAEKATSELMQRFTALAGLCAVFSKEIKHIEVNNTTYSWAPDRLLEASAAWCEFGQVQVPTKRGSVPTRLLVFRSRHGAAAIRLDGKAIPFDRDAEHAVPAIWVTGPTRGTAASGVLLNADFEIDTGRGSLAQGAGARRNAELVQKLTTSLAPAISQLVEATRKDWGAWSSRLATVTQTTVTDFWHAMWSVMFGQAISEDASEDAKLRSGFVRKLFELVLGRTGVVPNGMPGKFSTFADPTQLRLSVNSRLYSVLPDLAAWPVFDNAYPPSSWCSEDVAEWLRDCGFLDEDQSIEALDRASLFNALGSDRRVEPEQVVDLAKIMNAWPKGPTEQQGWRNELATIQLRSRSGTWRSATDLHFDGPGEDDLLAQFAPEEFLLDEAYSAHQVAWQVIRQYLSAGEFQASDIAIWCLKAQEDRRHFVVKWLATHLDAGLVWHYLRSLCVRYPWIRALHVGDPLFKGVEAGARDALLARLGISTSVHDLDDPEPPGASLDILTIHRWWMVHRDRHLPKYDQALWPQRIDRNKLAEDEAIDREAWMTLFSLGVFRRFGRIRDEQNRAFLEFLQTRGWWRTISDIHPDRGAEQWMNILREYAETNQVTGEFEQWMDSFPRLYRLARWCDEYVELFRGLQFRDKHEAKHLLTPATDASLSGSGFDAPTIHRTLRIGHNLVIRELLRVGVLNSDIAQSMAFMPGSAVLELLRQMGHEGLQTSEDIHQVIFDELDDPDLVSFGGDYDIPLILLANNPTLQQAVVDWAQTQNQFNDENEVLEEELP